MVASHNGSKCCMKRIGLHTVDSCFFLVLHFLYGCSYIPYCYLWYSLSYCGNAAGKLVGIRRRATNLTINSLISHSNCNRAATDARRSNRIASVTFLYVFRLPGLRAFTRMCSANTMMTMQKYKYFAGALFDVKISPYIENLCSLLKHTCTCYARQHI